MFFKSQHPALHPKAFAAGAVIVMGMFGVGSLAAPAAQGDTPAQITITDATGASPSPIYQETTLHLQASGFQSIQGGLGGIYVLVGVTEAADWQPSKGGKTGTDFAYVADDQQLTNAGYQRFVAFPGSQTSSEANGGEVAADGTWQAELTIPGPYIEVFNAQGDTRTVDCTQEKCGIITIGAHGVVNPNNETFTPLEFSLTPPNPSPTPSATPSAQPSTAASANPTTTKQPGSNPSANLSTPVKVGIMLVSVVVIISIGLVLLKGHKNAKTPGWVEERPAKSDSTQPPTD